jgi:nitroimidazol reductase NimA-like FMN-containing flavoprotein (pyridoxamine 5'-phosphate oxidase superfamily)
MATGTPDASWRTPPSAQPRPGQVDRNTLEVLSREECLRLIHDVPVGRVGMIVAGVAVIVPVNFAVLAGDVVFRTGSGSKLAAAVDHQPLTLEVDAFDPSTRTGWSVLVTGVASELVRGDDVAAADALGLQSWIAGRRRYIRIRSDEVSGRRLV